MRTVTIAGRPIGDGAPTYFIAEIGSNHDGSLSRGVELVEAAASAGADCVKFQCFTSDELVQRGVHPGYETLVRLALPDEWLPDLKGAAGRVGVHFTATPFSERAVASLVAVGVPVLKIASGDLTHAPLLRRCAATSLPLVISTGMAYLDEVATAVEIVRCAGDPPVVLLHCVSNYPPSFDDVNLRAMVSLRDRFQVPVGCSDHTPGPTVALGAVALGACVIEKHLTVDRSLKGPDHPFALTVEEFGAMVRAVRDLEAALGDGTKSPVAGEQPEREWARRGLWATRQLRPGDVLTDDALVALRPCRGLTPLDLEWAIGRHVRHRVQQGEPLTREALDDAAPPRRE